MMDAMCDYQSITNTRSAHVRTLFRFGAFVLLFVFTLASCGRFGSPKAVSGNDVSGAPTETPKARAPRHKPADHRILVMLGPDFTGKPAVVSEMADEYGLLDSAIPESPGMMTVLTWPDSFMVEKHARLSVLKTAADDPAVTIVVTIGAPEGTVRELTRIRAARPDIRIVTIFAEDDALPLEAVSDFVVDRVLPEGVLADENASASAGLSDDESGLLLLGSTLSAEEKDLTVPPLARLTLGLDTARGLSKQRRLGSDWVLASFIDPDTGLRSRNHLTVEIPVRSGTQMESSRAQKGAAGPVGSSGDEDPVSGSDGERS